MLENLFKPMHLLVIFFIIVLIYGPKKLGDLEGIRNFKSSMHEGSSANGTSSTTTTTTATPAPAPTPTEEKK